MIKNISWLKLLVRFQRALKEGGGSYPQTFEEHDALLGVSINTQMAALECQLKSLEYKYKHQQQTLNRLDRRLNRKHGPAE